MRPRDTAAIVFVQAGVIALIGLAVGVPAGIALGRAIWRSVAARTPVAIVVPGNWSTIALAVLAIVTLTAVLAIWPSRRLATMQLASELRTE
jgi:ABC-type antimicrobial peptide transport system permease subunit